MGTGARAALGGQLELLELAPRDGVLLDEHAHQRHEPLGLALTASDGVPEAAQHVQHQADVRTDGFAVGRHLLLDLGQLAVQGGGLGAVGE